MPYYKVSMQPLVPLQQKMYGNFLKKFKNCQRPDLHEVLPKRNHFIQPRPIDPHYWRFKQFFSSAKIPSQSYFQKRERFRKHIGTTLCTLIL